MNRFIEWIWPETKIRTLYPSELIVMQEIWGRPDGRVSGQEIVDIFEKRCGWNPKIIRAILDKKLVRMKKYLKKKPFGDIYIVRIGMEEGIAYQKEGWKKFKEGKPLSPEVVKEIKGSREDLQKLFDKEKELSRR